MTDPRQRHSDLASLSAADVGDLPGTRSPVRISMLQLAERFRPEDARGIDATWTVDVQGHPTYTIHVHRGRCLISPGSVPRPSVHLRTDADTWLAIVSGRVDGLEAFMTGDLVVEGDLHLAVRLETMFTPGPETTRIVRTTTTRVRGMELESLVVGHGTPVVLLHGLAANKLSFVPTLDGLSDRFEVHALDLPGFGRSDKPLPHGRRYSPAWMASVVRGYLTNNGIREAYLVGNSMGGRVATEAALRYPRMLRGFVTLGSAVAFDEWQPYGRLLRSIRGQWIGLASLPLRLDWIESAMIDVLFHDPSAIPAANMRAGAEDVLHSFGDRRYRLAVAAAARHLVGERADGKNGYWNRLADLHVPSYWIWGRQDRLVSSRYADRVKEILPHAQVEVWDNMGHVPQFEAPEQINDAIARFLTRIEAGH
ncbi:MAG: alpha/beta fold hydrolase [Nitriliruptorales bacterium]|nr:alpha/beta fold hydrolase [Nitriliruptorales bacterium]